MNINPEKIPASMKALPNWVMWKTIQRDKPTKVPFQTNDGFAKSNDPSTWTTFDDAWQRYERGGYDGIGFMFSKEAGLVGIDMDGCRNPETKELAPWAREVLDAFETYAEVSPSGTGIKLFCRGVSPLQGGKKKPVANAPVMCQGKDAAIEVYDSVRYFAVTGWRGNVPSEPTECPTQLAWLKEKFWPDVQPGPYVRSTDTVCDRARKYMHKMPPAISGQGGHNAAFHVACVLVLGFGLSEGEALGLMHEYNQTCVPPWSDRELLHKVRQANKQPGERCYLRDARQENWESISVPQYTDPTPRKPPAPAPTVVTLGEASLSHLARLEAGEVTLVDLGLPELDYAIGGGVAYGEMVVLAALPSHGKSAVALQLIHTWTSYGMPCFMVSEEMSPDALGKRAVQYIAPTPEAQWSSELSGVRAHVEKYITNHAKCYIAETCGSVEVAIGQIERYVKEHDVKCVVVDYTQQLRSGGKSKYEQVSVTSSALKKCAKDNNIILVALAQLNREIEKRGKFDPKMSDIRDSAQIGQDADVIIFQCWPWRIDPRNPSHLYEFYIGKNRNRPIRQWVVQCEFLSDRQMIIPPQLRNMKNYTPEFEQYNQ